MRSLSLLLVITLVPLLAWADDKAKENPFKTAKVGDWAEYKIVTKVANMTNEMKTKQTVTSVTEKEVKVKNVTQVMGKDYEQETTIDLTKPYDPSQMLAQMKTDATIEKGKEGTEKIKISGTEYDCTWQELKITITVQKQTIESNTKTWTSKSVPLGGTVKMEMKSNFSDMTMQLIGSGKGK